MRKVGLLVLGAVLACAGCDETKNKPGPGTTDQRWPALGPEFVVGVNQAWYENAYGHDLATKNPDVAGWKSLFGLAKQHGIQSVRIWVFEGRKLEGVRWAEGLPTGVDPYLLKNVDTLGQLAHKHGMTIYWTLLEGNFPNTEVLSDRATADAFREKVLRPFLNVVAAERDAVFAIDLINEVEGAIKAQVWGADERRAWQRARAFMKRTTAFVHETVPGLRVTASAGHHTAVDDVLAGHFDGLGFDLLDVHVYVDRPVVPHGKALSIHARRQGVPIVLGECGPEARDTKAHDPVWRKHQARITAGLLRDAESLGFQGAFPWRLEDPKEHAFTLSEARNPLLVLERIGDFARRLLNPPLASPMERSAARVREPDRDVALGESPARAAIAELLGESVPEEEPPITAASEEPRPLSPRPPAVEGRDPAARRTRTHAGFVSALHGT